MTRDELASKLKAAGIENPRVLIHKKGDATYWRILSGPEAGRKETLIEPKQASKLNPATL